MYRGSMSDGSCMRNVGISSVQLNTLQRACLELGDWRKGDGRGGQ